MFENIGGRDCKWYVDIDMNKVCIDAKTGELIKKLEPSVTEFGVIIRPHKAYRAVLNGDFEDMFGTTHKKGTDIKVNEMLNGKFFITANGSLISTKGEFSQFTIVFDYEKMDKESLEEILVRVVESEEYVEASKIKKAIDRIK